MFFESELQLRWKGCTAGTGVLCGGFLLLFFLFFLFMKSIIISISTIVLADIAVSVGFPDQSYYCKIFKRIVGVSPGKFRSQPGVAAEENE